MLVFSSELICYAERGGHQGELGGMENKESEFRERDALGTHTSPLAKMCSEKKNLPDRYMFLGHKERGSPSLSWNYRCQTEC